MVLAHHSPLVRTGQLSQLRVAMVDRVVAIIVAASMALVEIRHRIMHHQAARHRPRVGMAAEATMNRRVATTKVDEAALLRSGNKSI